MHNTDLRTNVVLSVLMPLAMVYAELPAADSPDAESVSTEVVFEKPASQGEYRIPGINASAWPGSLWMINKFAHNPSQAEGCNQEETANGR